MSKFTQADAELLKKGVEALLKTAWGSSKSITTILEEFMPDLNDYKVTSFDKSEETESGVFGVHIVFEKKKEGN